MMEMGHAAAESGSSLDGINKMLQKLQIAQGDAAAGSDKMRAAFEAVGESGRSLNSSTLDLTFLRVAKALSEIPDAADRAAKANELFGKTSRGFDWAGYVSNIEKVYGTMDQYAAATKRADEVAEQFESMISLLKSSFLNLLDPILKIAAPTGTFAEKMALADTAAKLLAGSLAIIVAGTVVNGVKSIAGAMSFLTVAMGSSAATTTAATASMSNYARAMATFMTPALARVASATTAVAVAELHLQSIRTSQFLTIAELTAAETALATAKTRLAVATEAQAVTSAQAAAAIGAAGIASGASVAPTLASGAAAGTAATGWRVLAGAMLAALAPMAAMAAAAGAVYAVYQAVVSADGSNWISDLVGITDETKRIEAATKEVGTATAANTKLSADQEEQKKKQAAAEAWRTSTAVAGLFAEAEKIRDVTRASREAEQQAAARIKTQISSVQSGASEQATALALAGKDAIFKSKQDILKIDQDIAAQRAKLNDPGLSAGQKAGINEVIKAYQEQKKSMDGVVERTVELKRLDMERAGILDMQNQILGAQQKATEMVFDLEKELAQQTMTTNERRLDDIGRMVAAEQRAAVKSFEAAAGRKATAQEAAAINNKIAASYDGIYNKTKKVIDQSRDFSTGWGRAMKQYVEDAGNAATQAESLFKKATQGMEDAIVNFAKTGKFEWKGFVASMLEELLRSQIKQLFAHMMNSMSSSLGGLAAAFGTAGVNNQTSGNTGGGGSGGGILDAIGSLFGGGSSAKGTPVFVTNMPGGTGFGGAGGSASGSPLLDTVNSLFSQFPNSPATGQTPGIFSGGTDGSNALLDAVNGLFGGGQQYPNSPAVSVPSTASGGGIGGGGFFSGIADTFSSIGDSIGSLFDGWFADGGSIGAGKFGIVGERGAELVRGPGTVMPLNGSGSGSGGTTNITYNINAVDAMSFKQMVAADPSFIYAVTMQGAKGMRA
jgi:lambda family phage tail tape measure protein